MFGPVFLQDVNDPGRLPSQMIRFNGADSNAKFTGVGLTFYSGISVNSAISLSGSGRFNLLGTLDSRGFRNLVSKVNYAGTLNVF